MSSSYSTFFWLFFCNKFWFLSLFYQIFTSIIINYYRYLKLSFFYFSFYLFTSFTDSSYFKELKTCNDHEFSIVPISLISDHENVIQHNSKFESLNRQVAKIKKLENLRNFDFLTSCLPVLWFIRLFIYLSRFGPGVSEGHKETSVTVKYCSILGIRSTNLNKVTYILVKYCSVLEGCV